MFEEKSEPTPEESQLENLRLEEFSIEKIPNQTTNSSAGLSTELKTNKERNLSNTVKRAVSSFIKILLINNVTVNKVIDLKCF